MRCVRRLVTLCVLGVAICLTAPPAAADAPAAGWTWPVPAAGTGRPGVVHGFAPPEQPWLPGHRGVDLQARAGAVVRAAAAGRVHFAGRIGRTWVVSVLHPDGLLTTYEPVRPTVRRGAWVRRGQALGRLLLTGSHCGSPCLHWGLRRGTAYLDPLGLVGAARVRLLPLYPPGGPLAPPVPVSAAAVGMAAFTGLRRCRRRPRSGLLGVSPTATHQGEGKAPAEQGRRADRHGRDLLPREGQ